MTQNEILKALEERVARLKEIKEEKENNINNVKLNEPQYYRQTGKIEELERQIHWLNNLIGEIKG